MAVIAIPFDYDSERDSESVIPIYLNDTDENGETISFGWIEAVVPIQEKLRDLSRRVLGDVWRVSEVTDLAIHQLWYQYRENLGPDPSFRVYRTAKRAAHSLEDPGGREHRALNLSLDALEEYRKDSLIGDAVDTERAYEMNLDIEWFEKKIRHMGRKSELDVYRLLRAGYCWHEIGQRMGERPNTLHRRFQRLVKRIADIMQRPDTR